MTRLTPRTPSEMTEKQRELYDQMAEGRDITNGYIGGPFDAWGLNPSTGRRIWQLGGALRFKPTIDRRYIELAILMTGQLWQAQFEWFAHEPMARDAGLPEEVIQAVKIGTEPSFTDDGDEICWQFCRRLLDRSKIDPATYQATVDRFGEAGVGDLINACGFYTLVSMTLNTFEVGLPDGAEPPFPA
ncbi:MAG: carboxymuconolactone decarboxylase family protein [Acidimicrobiia bacterium]|nr:carboxymuconolactone decarboxylase family protein [Acidimicrobiia bacterium]